MLGMSKRAHAHFDVGYDIFAQFLAVFSSILTKMSFSLVCNYVIEQERVWRLL